VWVKEGFLAWVNAVKTYPEAFLELSPETLHTRWFVVHVERVPFFIVVEKLGEELLGSMESRQEVALVWCTQEVTVTHERFSTPAEARGPDPQRLATPICFQSSADSLVSLTSREGGFPPSSSAYHRDDFF
jgi:hypothetical protein